MITVKKEDLDDLKKLGAGKFGAVYQKDEETAYKIYFKSIADECGFAHDNPSLLLSKSRFKRLIKKSKELFYTGGVLDIINIDGEFAGVVIPYYEGETLSNLMDIPIRDKVFIANQIITCSKELFSNNIYPFDYKLNNVILSNNQVRLIDLDDVHTHVCHTPNPIGHLISINGLNEMLETFFKEHRRTYVPRNISKQLLRNNGRFSITHKSLEGYIKDKFRERDFVLIRDDSDLDEIKELSKHYNVVYIAHMDQEEYPIVDLLREENIPLYDIVKENKVEEYSEIENTGKVLIK